MQLYIFLSFLLFRNMPSVKHAIAFLRGVTKPAGFTIESSRNEKKITYFIFPPQDTFAITSTISDFVFPLLLGYIEASNQSYRLLICAGTLETTCTKYCLEFRLYIFRLKYLGQFYRDSGLFFLMSTGKI